MTIIPGKTVRKTGCIQRFSHPLSSAAAPNDGLGADEQRLRPEKRQPAEHQRRMNPFDRGRGKSVNQRWRKDRRFALSDRGAPMRSQPETRF